MLRALLAALALGAAVATPATAGPPENDHYFDGGCGLYAVETAPSSHRGVLYGHGHAYSVWYEHDPVTVTYLTCDVMVSGVVVATAGANGTGPVVVVPPEEVTYTADVFTDVVTVCESYQTVDAHGGTETVTRRCFHAEPPQVVPRQVTDAYEYYLADSVEDLVVNVVDPLACAALAELAPTQVRDLFRVEPGGDTYAGDLLVYDCPPYAAP